MENVALQADDIDKLLSFLPSLDAPGFKPIVRWGGGTKDESGVYTMPWPEYSETVARFFGNASKECWSDNQYLPELAGAMLKNEALVAVATIDQIKTMLTFCVRGERFCDGHWGAMIEEGYVRRLLSRLQELRRQ